MVSDLKVFISSDMEELENERKVAVDAIKYVCLMPVFAEDFDSMHDKSSEVYFTELKDSDIALFILDRSYNSHVESEYMHASKYEKPIFFFIRERIEKERDSHLNAIIRNIPAGCVFCNYSNNEDLSQKIKGTILKYISDQVRSSEKVDYSRVYDLSRPIEDENLILLGHTINPKFDRLQLPTYWRKPTGDLVAIFDSGVLHIPTNICTHIDFPNHLAYSPNILIKDHIEDDVNVYKGKCITIDCSDIINQYLIPHLDNSGYLKIEGKDEEAQNENYINILKNLEISLDYFTQKLIQDFEIESIGDLKNYFVLLYTGLDKYWTKEVYTGQEWRYAYFLNPFLSEDLVNELVKSQIKGIGSDTYRLENPILNLSKFQSSVPFSKKSSLLPEVIQNKINKINDANLMHYKFLSKNILIIENLSNLETIKNRISLLLALPPRIKVQGANTDMFVRAVAFKIINPSKK